MIIEYRNRPAETLENPEASIIENAEKAAPGTPIVIPLGDGIYRLDRPAVLSAKEHPALSGHPITLKAAEGAHPVITSNVVIDPAAFKKIDGKSYYRCQLAKGADGKYPLFRDFFVDGKRVKMTHSEIFKTPYGYADQKNHKNPENFKGIYLPVAFFEKLSEEDFHRAELMIYVEWEFAILRIKSIDWSDRTEAFDTQYVRVFFYDEYDAFILLTNHCLDFRFRECMIVNSPAFMEPETFVYDVTTGELFYQPKDAIEGHTYEYPTLENLLIAEGLNGLELEGITFTGTTSKFACENGYLSGQSNCEKRNGAFDMYNNGEKLRHAAVLTGDMRGLSVRNCSFCELGGNGLMMYDRSVGVDVHDSVFENIGMGAISIGNATIEWEDPKNQNIALRITNNYFHDVGYEYPSSLAIFVGMVDGLKLLHNTIDGTSYSAVSIGWGWHWVDYELGEKINVRDAEMAYNRIVNYMMILRDGAALYTVGANCTEKNTTHFNTMHDNYAERELFPDMSRRGYYMDGASSNWEVYDSVTIGTKLPLFSQFHVPDQFTHNNYMHDIYTVDKIDDGNHAPYRNTILGKCYCLENATREELFAAYPKAKEIFEASGRK